MPKENRIKTNWSSGEVSPLLRGRVDVNRYENGAEELENFISVPQGAITKRTGFEFIRATKLSTGAIAVPFKFSDQDSYMLEIGDGYIHFFKDGKPVHETTTTEVESFLTQNNGGSMRLVGSTVNALPGWGAISVFYGTTSNNGTIVLSSGAAGVVRVTTSVPHTLRTGVKVLMRSTLDPNTIDNTEFTVTRISAYAVDLQGTTFVSNPASVAMFTHGLLPGDWFYVTGAPEYPTLTEQWHLVKLSDSYAQWTLANVAYVNNGVPTGEEAWTIPVEVVSPWALADLANLRFFQSADVLYVVSPDYAPYKLQRLDDDGDRNDWLLAAITFNDGPYLPLNNLAPNIDTTTPANGSTYSDVYLEVSSYTHTATVTSATAFAAGTPSADQGKYLEYRDRDQWRLALLSTAAGGATTGTVTILDNVLLFLDETTKLTDKYVPGTANNTASIRVQSYRGNPGAGFRTVSQQRVDPNNEIASDKPVALGVIAAGKLTSQFSNTFSTADIGKYVRVKDTARDATAYWVQITSLASTSNGNQANHAQSVAMVSNNTTGKFVISAITRSCTVKSYKAGAAFNMFRSDDVGRHIRLGFAGRWTWGIISAYTSASQVTVTLYEDMPRDPHNAANVAGNQDSAAPTSGISYDWRLGAFSARGSGSILGPGWPSCGCFHEQRMVLGRTDAQPDSMFFSVSGDFENFQPTELDSTVLDDSGFVVSIASGEVNAIEWLLSSDVLLVGTVGGIYMVAAQSIQNEPVSPTNASVRRGLSHGSSILVQPVIAGNSVLFMQTSGRKLREAAFADDITFGSRLISKDLTVVSEPMTKRGLTAIQTAWQEEPNGILWVLLNDGTLSAMTYNREQEIVAWHHHELSNNADADAFGDVESIAVIPSGDGTHDELWAVVKRTINGGTKRYMERLAADWLPASSTDRDSMPFMDSHLIFDFSSNKTVVEGLTHLEGVNVDIIIDGHNAGNMSVSSGQVDVSGIDATGGQNFVIGCTYHARMKSLPPEGGSAFGTSQGQPKRLVYLDARFVNSLTVQFGFEDDNADLEAVSDDNGTSGLSGTGAVFTGTKRLITNHGFDNESRYVITDAFPYPMTIACVVLKLETNE